MKTSWEVGDQRPGPGSNTDIVCNPKWILDVFLNVFFSAVKWTAGL